MHVHVGGEWVAMYALAPTLLDTPDTPDTGPTLARHWPDTSDTSDTPTHQGSREPVTLTRARRVSHDTRSFTITKLASPGPGR